MNTNPYPYTFELRVLIRSAYCYAKRAGLEKVDRKTFKEYIKESYEKNHIYEPILKQAQRRIAQGKTIKLP